MFESVLVANRGEIAVRVMRTARRLGLLTVAVHSEADAGALHVRAADQAVLIGPAPAQQSYLSIDSVLEAAQVSGAKAVHPGYGFLSESAEFARRVTEAGLVWIGPSPEAIEAMGDKIAARNAMAAAGVPVAPGTVSPLTSVEPALAEAERLGYPLMVKAAAGGGGIGMAPVSSAAELSSAFETARTRAERFFGSPSILLERFVRPARHVEVQVLGLADGTAVALGERDCSVQRRRQKVLEETPAPALPASVREDMLAAAVRAAESVGYRGAGTVEFLLDPRTHAFAFLEMNTRLQVEHPVTELVTGLDLVEEQFRIAAGEAPTFTSVPAPQGHAVEFRVYAEDPVRFFPGPGKITAWTEPAGDGIRVDAGYAEGDEVTPYYDPLLAKLCAWGPDRASALARLAAAAADFTVEGPKCNLPLLPELLASPALQAGEYDTDLIETIRA